MKTIFFITSTKHRNYKYFVNSLSKLHKDNLNFEIIVIGSKKFLKKKKITKKLCRYFSFKYDTPYNEMYKLINKSDFIIVPFEPKNSYDNSFRTIKVSGSVQLGYGFLKPIIINKNFAEFYFLNNKNSLLYENNELYTIMKEAIKMNNKKYYYLQTNLKYTAGEIYKISINNVKKTINYINKNF